MLEPQKCVPEEQRTPTPRFLLSNPLSCMKLLYAVTFGTSLTGTSSSIPALGSAGVGSSYFSSIGSSGVGARGGLKISCVISVIRE